MCSFSFLYTIFPALSFLLKQTHFYVGTFGLRPTVNTWMIEFSFSGTWCSRGHEWSLLHSLQWECPHFRRRADDLLWNLWNGVSEQELHTNRCANPQESAMSVSCRQSFSIVGRCVVCLTSLRQVTIPTPSIMQWICVQCLSYFCWGETL